MVIDSEIEVPWFATETEEADWWYNSRERLAEEMLRASEQGISLVTLRIRHRVAAKPATVDPSEKHWLEKLREKKPLLRDDR